MVNVARDGRYSQDRRLLPAARGSGEKRGWVVYPLRLVCVCCDAVTEWVGSHKGQTNFVTGNCSHHERSEQCNCFGRSA